MSSKTKRLNDIVGQSAGRIMNRQVERRTPPVRTNLPDGCTEMFIVSVRCHYRLICSSLWYSYAWESGRALNHMVGGGGECRTREGRTSHHHDYHHHHHHPQPRPRVDGPSDFLCPQMSFYPLHPVILSSCPVLVFAYNSPAAATFLVCVDLPPPPPWLVGAGCCLMPGCSSLQ